MNPSTSPRNMMKSRLLAPSTHVHGGARGAVDQLHEHPAPSTVRGIAVEACEPHSHEALTKLFALLPSFTSVMHLELIRMPLSARQVSLLELDLKVLDLSHSLPGDAGALALRQCSARHAHAIYLQGCGLTNIGLRHLRACEEVMTLDLGGNPHLITQPKDFEFFDAFEWLETLSLLGTLTPETLEHLICYLTAGGLPSLTSLAVGGDYRIPLPMLYGLIRTASLTGLELLQIDCHSLGPSSLQALRRRLKLDQIEVAVYITHGGRRFTYNT